MKLFDLSLGTPGDRQVNKFSHAVISAFLMLLLNA